MTYEQLVEKTAEVQGLEPSSVSFRKEMAKFVRGFIFFTLPFALSLEVLGIAAFRTYIPLVTLVVVFLYILFMSTTLAGVAEDVDMYMTCKKIAKFWVLSLLGNIGIWVLIMMTLW